MCENYPLFREAAGDGLPLTRERSIALLRSARFGPAPDFERRLRD